MTNSKGERLRLIIEHSGYSQKKFAEKAGIEAGYLRSIIGGLKGLSGGVLEQISDAYGDIYNIGWLISGKGEMVIENQPSQAAEPPAIYRPSGSIEQRILELERRADRTEKILDALFQYRETR